MRKPIKIIAFEDEFLHAEKLKQAVEEIGYSLLSINEDVLKLEELVMDHSPDVVIMDIDLGYGGDGIEAVAKLRRNSNVPVIFLTSFC